MPTTNYTQRSLIDNEPVPHRPDPWQPILCVGGCGCERPRVEMVDTPEGYMCPRCYADRHTVCTDCGEEFTLNSYRESSNLIYGGDGNVRCRPCHDAAYSICKICNRTTRRDSNDVHDHPSEDGEVCHRCWNDYWFICDVCGEIYDRTQYRGGLNDAKICSECFDAAYVACGQCGVALIRGEHLGWEDDPFCESCYGRAETWKTQPWSGEPGSFDKVGSTRRFGVEIETAECRGYEDLHGKTEWGCVHECSTSGKEFVSPILQGNAGFQEIRDLCEVAREKHWTVNNSCGLHIHLDTSEDSSEECLRIAYAYRKTYTLWKKFVSNMRGDNSMCGSPQYSCEDIRLCEHIEDFAEGRDRFEFVNWRAYLRHGSFEVRLYGGSLNAREICNWIALHTRFMDAVKGMTYDELDEKLGGNIRRHWPALCDLLSDTNLLDYWRRKANNHGTELAKCWDAADEPSEPRLAAPSNRWAMPLSSRPRPAEWSREEPTHYESAVEAWGSCTCPGNVSG